MSWIDTLDRLITDSWMASRDESAVMLDSLLALSLVERWDLFVTRDPRLSFLSDEDYVVLFRSLNTHALIAQATDRAAAIAADQVTEEATSVLPAAEAPEGHPLHLPQTGHPATATHEAATHQAATHEAGASDHALHEQAPEYDDSEEPLEHQHAAARSWWRSRPGIRFLSLGAAVATGILLVGALLTVTVLYLLPGTPSVGGGGTEALFGKLDEVERDQAQFARRLVQVDTQLSDLATHVDDRFDAAMRAVTLTSAIDRLQRTMDRGLPFTAELAGVAPAASGGAALAALVTRLDGYAASGVPSQASLRDRFEEMAPRLTVGERGAIGRFFGWLGSGIGLESAEQHRFQGALAGIAAALRLGTLASAIRQLEDLHAHPADPVDQWLAAAKITLDADATLDALRQAVVSSPTFARAR